MTELSIFDMSAADDCVACGLCLPHCPTFRLTGDELYSPRGRLAAMNAVVTGIADIDADFDDSLSTCLGCMACEAVCPGLVPYGDLFEAARANLTAARPTVPRRIRRLLLGRLLPWRPGVGALTAAADAAQRMRIGRFLPSVARRGLAGLRPLRGRGDSWVGRVVEPEGTLRGTAGLLAGCVMDPWFGAVHEACVDLLSLAGYRVVVTDAQTCCGALAAHDGHVRVARRLAARNVRAFEGVDMIVADAAGCSAHLKHYEAWAGDGESVATRARDVTEVIADLIADGVLPTAPPNGRRVAIQDPCHLRHAQRVVAAPRKIVAAAGHEVVEIDEDGLCCGAAGIYSATHPETSEQLGRRKASQVVAAGVSVVASANPGCEMQLRTYLPEGTRIAHPVELYREWLRDN